MRLTRVSFHLIAISVAGISCQAVPAPPGPTVPENVLLVYLADASPAPHLTPSLIPTTGETIYLDSEPVLTARDVQEAELKSDSFGNPMLELSLTPAGSQRLSDATLRNRGKRLAFVCQSVVLVAPLIFDPITDGTAVIGGEGLGTEIEQLARELQVR